jgi:uroporphyrinogen decarboxylase
MLDVQATGIDRMDRMTTPRQRFIAALERQPITGRVPHFELVFFLTMEAFGKVHPSHRHYAQWDQMQEKERQLHRNEMAALYIATAERYEHSAIFLHPNPNRLDETMRLIDLVRAKSGDRYFLMLHGDATFSIPDGARLEQFAYRLADEPQALKAEATDMVDRAIERAEALCKHSGLDGFALCSDYCFNNGPFMSPGQFSEFVTPYLARLTKAYRDMGFYVIKHTDGDIMPIVDQLVQTGPHALHSLDPQGNVDIAKVKKLYGDKVCLIGNVSCALLDTGTEQECIESARYCLRHGMPGGGYIFSTSNCIYTGMELSRYELILDVWRNEGNYV